MKENADDYFNQLVSKNRLEDHDYIGYFDTLQTKFGISDEYDKQELVNTYGSYKKEKNRNLVEELVEAHGGIDGMELSTPSGRLHVVITGEAQEEGKFRLTNFDSEGLSGHSTFNSAEEVLKEAVSSGYKDYNPGIMDDLATKPEWQTGMEKLANIDRIKANEDFSP